MAPLTPNALRVLEARYLRRDDARRLAETPDGMFERVARAVAAAEGRLGNGADEARWRTRFGEVMAGLKFLPNSPTLMNAGAPLGQLAACFVIPVDDSMEAIFEALKQMALVQRTGGGTGFSFSRLRPQGDIVSATDGAASGPVSFMRIFDAATEHIRQGGKRRGANMGVLRVDHPDVMAFIEAKADGVSLRNFNISVAATDAFMRAAAAGDSYALISPRTGDEVGRADAGAVFDALCRGAWATGDPGLLFIDAINRANPTPHRGAIEATNPCGEVPLLPWEACNLGSVNLARMLRHGPEGPVVDWTRLEETVRTGVRLLDDVIEVNRLPGHAYEEVVRGNRKVGLGVMGFAEMLITLGIPYDAPEAARMAGEVMGRVRAAADAASADLAVERGVYPWWAGSVHEREGVRYRNATRTAIAPTGTIGIIAGTSASIEPLFALAYRRHALDGQVLEEVNPLFLRALREAGLPERETVNAVVRAGGVRRAPGLPDALRERFVTALEVGWEGHLAVQAAFQSHVDNSVSKTINLPATAPVEQVAAAYRGAWERGLKGITVYRYGSQDAQVLEIGPGEDPMVHEYAARCDPEECRV
jgi:ribonucleoside-diphosphate reductase alpha chain